jgi:hypothetical protein
VVEPRQPKNSGAFDEDFEAVRSAWSDLPREEPPDLIDQAVLNSAGRQIAASSRRRKYQWMGALTTAAVVVLAVNLVVRQEPQAPAPPPAPTDGFRMDRAETRPGSRGSESGEAAGRPQPLRQVAPETAQPAGKLSAPPAEEQSVADEPGGPSEHERPGGSEVPQSPATALPLQEASDGLLRPLQKASDGLLRPDDWIDRLLALREAGEEEALLRELAEFRAAYPDYPLPRELAGL